MFKLSKLFLYYGSRKSTSNDSIIFHKRKEKMFIQLLLISGQAFFSLGPWCCFRFPATKLCKRPYRKVQAIGNIYQSPCWIFF